MQHINQSLICCAGFSVLYTCMYTLYQVGYVLNRLQTVGKHEFSLLSKLLYNINIEKEGVGPVKADEAYRMMYCRAKRSLLFFLTYVNQKELLI